MPIFFDDEDPAETVARARALADDLESLLDCGHPSPVQLAAAPILDWWRPATRLREESALIGVFQGHPQLVAGRTAVTSGLLALDVDGGWARTRSRFYRLSRRCPGRRH